VGKMEREAKKKKRKKAPPSSLLSSLSITAKDAKRLSYRSSLISAWSQGRATRSGGLETSARVRWRTA